MSAMPRLFVVAAMVAALSAPALAGVEKYGDQFKNGEIGLNKVPHVGKSRVLVVPLEFGKNYDFGHLDAFFDNSDSAAYSFRKYWQINSYGKFDVEVEVLPIMHFDSCPAENNPKCEFTVKNGFDAITVVEAVFARLDAEGVDFTRYDTNGPDGKADGFADGIIFLVPNYTGGIAPPIYPFMKDVDGNPAYTWDGITVGAIAISNTDAQTILHEFGHLLGYADLYNFSLDYSLMSTCDTCLLDAHSRLKIGWAEALDVAPGETIDALLRPADLDPTVLRIAGEDPREYFLVEYRREATYGQSTLDTGLDGLAVFHVDENKEAPVIAQSNYPAWHPLIMNERPSNNQTEARLFQAHDELLPNAGGDQLDTDVAKVVYWNSNWYDGAWSGVRIDEVRQVNEDGPAFRLRVRGVTPYEAPGPEPDAGTTDPGPGPTPDAGGADDSAAPIGDAQSGDATVGDVSAAAPSTDDGGCRAPIAAPTAPWALLAALAALGWLRRRVLP